MTATNWEPCRSSGIVDHDGVLVHHACMIHGDHPGLVGRKMTDLIIRLDDGRTVEECLEQARREPVRIRRGWACTGCHSVLWEPLADTGMIVMYGYGLPDVVETLTAGELDILLRLAGLESIAEVARATGRTESTIRTHLGRVSNKLQIPGARLPQWSDRVLRGIQLLDQFYASRTKT